MTNRLTDVDRRALERSVEIARRDPAEANRIDVKLAQGADWYDVATSAAFHCQMAALNLLPYESPPCAAHIVQPRRDEQAAELLRRLLDAGLSRFEPDPIRACEAAERAGKRLTPAK